MQKKIKLIFLYSTLIIKQKYHFTQTFTTPATVSIIIVPAFTKQQLRFSNPFQKRNLKLFVQAYYFEHVLIPVIDLGG
jgi:hypothetical protein